MIKNLLKFCQTAVASVLKKREVPEYLKFKGVFKGELIRNGVVIATMLFNNGVTTEGKNKVLDVMFHGTTQITTWYLGLMDNSGYTAESAADTLASHTGWTEFTTYTGSRPAWTEGAAAAGVITNAATVDFAITGGGTLKGLFLCSAASGTSGTLWATGAFTGGTTTVINGDTLRITYTVSC